MKKNLKKSEKIVQAKTESGQHLGELIVEVAENKIMKHLATLFISVIITSFAPALSSENISVYLQPKHKTYAGFNKHNYHYVELLDNDGNLYVTFWDISEATLNKFKMIVKQCREKIRERRLFNKAQHISDINTDSIKPSLFKEFNLCIREKDFIHKNSDAFYPGSYQLSIYRGHSTTGKYMPVGGSYKITRKNTDYKRVLSDVKICVDKTNHNNKSETYEMNSTHISQVNIEPFANSIETCLKDISYTVTPSKTKQTNNTVKGVRDKDTHLDPKAPPIK